MHLVEDIELLARAASGDHEAFAVFYDRHSVAVARYAWTWSESDSAMQDLVQETFITAWKKADSIRIVGSSALPWLLVTCRNHAGNHRRKATRRREVPLEAAPAQAISTDFATERYERVADILATLDERDQLLCRLCLIEGHSYKEAAHELGETVSWVGKRLQRARQNLRKGVLSDEQI